MRRFIPNLLTLLNLLCGAVAITITLFAGANLETRVLNAAVFLIVLGAIFDVFDGFTARKLGVASPLGVQLDSLADLITFGFAPSILYFHLQLSHATAVSPATLHSLLVFSPLMLLLFSAYRLAKFNIDTEQRYYFKGLATPASALFTLGIVLAIENDTASPLVLALMKTDYNLPIVVLLQGVMVVSNIPMFSLKFKHFTFANALPHLLFLLILVLALIFFKWEGLSLAMIAYILLSLLFRNQIKIV
jgi:CDP-alcohol phosphatidyltransferase